MIQYAGLCTVVRSGIAQSDYDQVWIVGSPDSFDAPQQYQFPPALRAKTRFTDYVRRGCGQRSARSVRQALGLSATDPLVLVTPGGGGDGSHLRALTCDRWRPCPPK